MNYITQETAQLIEACKALSDYVHAEQSSTDGQVTYSTSTINHHVFQIRAALAQPAKPVELSDAEITECWEKVSGTKFGYAPFARAAIAAANAKERT